LVGNDVLCSRNVFLGEKKERTVSTQPNQGKGQRPDQDRYNGYAGYQPRKPAEDPYGAYYQPSDNQQGGTTGTAGAGKQQSDPGYVYGQQQQQGQQYKSSSTSSGQRQQQQSSAYQPPSSVSGWKYGSSSQASSKLEPRYAAVLSYLGICFTGLFFFFWERKNRLVRFSAAQSIVLFFPLLVVYSILSFLIKIIGSVWFVGWLLAGLLNAAVIVLIIVPGVALWLYLMFHAYRGVEKKLPYVGEYAERLLRLFSPRQKKGGY
jgi:uncharacterized membrane protein